MPEDEKDNRTVPKYVLEVTKTTLTFLAALADGLPIPAKGVITAVQKVIELVEVRLDPAFFPVSQVMKHPF